MRARSREMRVIIDQVVSLKFLFILLQVNNFILLILLYYFVGFGLHKGIL